jgi:hypothetical protein
MRSQKSQPKADLRQRRMRLWSKPLAEKGKSQNSEGKNQNLEL